MAKLIDNPDVEWTDNEIYQIAGTDPVEGAMAGASFGGIGILNEPHQGLANRTAWLKRRQDTNIASIAALQAASAALRSLLGANGWLKIPTADVNLGSIVTIVQWGIAQVTNRSRDRSDVRTHERYPGHDTVGGQGGTTAIGVGTVVWPIAFPNVCEAGFVLNTGAVRQFKNSDEHNFLAGMHASFTAISPTGGTVGINVQSGEDEADEDLDTQITFPLNFIVIGY